MALYSIAIVLTLLFVIIDCRHHAKHRLMRQQNLPQNYGNPYPEQPPAPPQPAFNSNQYTPDSNPVAPVPALPPQPPPPPPPPPPPESSGSQPFYSAPGNPPPPATAAFAPVSSMGFPSEVNPNYSPSLSSSKRRKKNVADKNNEITDLFESGKKLLDLPSENWKRENFTLEGGETISNITFKPIPGGMNLISASKDDGRKIDANVNITSSSEKTISFGNSTEIENVVEMQMEKKIEDEKGANQGSEEVHIIETERVKPVLNKKLKNMYSKRRKKKSNRRMGFPSHHRNKRSKTEYAESQTVSVFDKMAKHFFSTLVRKERIAKQNDLSSSEQIMNKDVNDNSIDDQQNKLQSAGFRKVIIDFMNFFVNEMKKTNKLQENTNKSTRHSNFSKKFLNKSFQPKVKRIPKTMEFPEPINVAMNINMSWKHKIKDNSMVKSERDIETHRTSTVNVTEAALPLKITTTQMSPALPFFKNNNDSRVLDYIFIFVVVIITFYAVSSLLIFWNMRRTGRVSQRSAARTYRFYNHGQKNKILGVEDCAAEKEYTEDSSKLEWQLEDGNWLST